MDNQAKMPEIAVLGYLFISIMTLMTPLLQEAGLLMMKPGIPSN